MAQFYSPDQAVSCAFAIQGEMKAFNENQNKLDFPLRLRIGISTGEIDKDVVTGEIADFLLDAAGTLQKCGIPGNVNIFRALSCTNRCPALFRQERVVLLAMGTGATCRIWPVDGLDAKAVFPSILRHWCRDHHTFISWDIMDLDKNP